MIDTANPELGEIDADQLEELLVEQWQSLHDAQQQLARSLRSAAAAEVSLPTTLLDDGQSLVKTARHRLRRLERLIESIDQELHAASMHRTALQQAAEQLDERAQRVPT
jgi:ABC-type transporter Mla subunit MlaD